VPIGPITRAGAKKLKKALNGLVQIFYMEQDGSRGAWDI